VIRGVADSAHSLATAPIADFGLAQALSALKRRVLPMLLAFAAVAVAAAMTAILWPPTYRSTGTILIEQQEIPTDIVRSAVSSYADQRVQVISQRVMTSANLLGIVEKYKLYGKARDTSPREALTDRMRKDIRLQMISADVMDPRQGRATKATIAFTVSYESDSPVLAARVTNELATLYLSENIQSRKQLAASTADFLRDESERLGRSIAGLEQKLADFKAQYGEKLPEFQQFNLQSLEGARQELRDLDARVRSLDQQAVFLDSQLAQIDPTGAAYTQSGERVLSSKDRLKVLRSQLASARALYGNDHPDVQRYQREVDGLVAQVGPAASESQQETRRRLADARAQLAQARERLTDAHPDVLRLERETAGLEAELRNPAVKAEAPAEEEADNPAYIQIRAQKAATLAERTSLLQQAALVRRRVTEVEERQAAAPVVEQEYSLLLRDLANDRAKYAEVRQKQMEAQVVQNLETERKGERFTLIEPPIQPTRPVSPNREMIALLGIVMALALALALGYLLEQLDTTIRDRGHLARLVGVSPLAIVPLLTLDEDVAAKRRRVRWSLAAGVGALVLALPAIHLFVRPLDLVWLTLLRRFA
jgi:uncharacterized protein involved in exopolysaccharide biosynthesis